MSTGRYKLPRQLQEHKLLCKDAGKPLALLALLTGRLAEQPTLVFAASVETAHRSGLRCTSSRNFNTMWIFMTANFSVEVQHRAPNLHNCC